MMISSVVAMLVLGGAAPAPPALEKLAEEIRLQLSRTQPEAPVAVLVEGSPPLLARSLATLTAAKLAASKWAPMVLEAGGDSEGRAAERGARTLLRVTVALENQKLVARGDAFSVWANFWSGHSPSRAPKAAMIVATLEADAEALTIAGAALPAATALTSLDIKASVLARLDGPPSAVTSGDIDGDGRPEVVVMVHEDVLVLSAEGRVMAKYDLSLAPRASLPTRDAFGVVAVLSSTRVVAWSGKRARPEVLSWSGGALRAAGGVETVTVDGLGVKLEPGFRELHREIWTMLKDEVMKGYAQTGGG